MKINLEDVINGLPRRLAEFLNYKGLNQRQFAMKTGLSNGLINQFFKKGTNLGSDKVLKILSTFPDLDANWWFKGEGMMITESAVKMSKYAAAAGDHWEQLKGRILSLEEEMQKIRKQEL